jgi:hypothetical protein
MMGSLYSWKSKKIPSIRRELEKLRIELQTLADLTDETSIRLKKKLTEKMDEMLYREELSWLQRSRVDWLRAGDRNTKYFHRRASRRQQKNKIRNLKRPDGTVTTDCEEMEQLATCFFQNLFTKDASVTASVVIDLLQAKVDDQMNESLTAPFSEKEIGDALFQIGQLKAPGPDGYPARFLQRNWCTLLR